jgi:hypothetical protein
MKNSTNVLAGALTLTVTLLLSSPAAAQDAAQPTSNAPERGLYLTTFRSPATGLEYRTGRFAIHAGYYVTVIKADGQPKGQNTSFVRTGASFYLRPAGWTPYVSPSLVISLDDDWDNGILTEVGLRVPIFSRAKLRGGVGILRTFDGRTRVNPTIGLDVRLGS